MDSCPFCSVGPDRVVLANETAIAFPDRYPLSESHTLVTPRQHVATIYELSGEEQGQLWSLVAEVRKKLIEKFQPDGFNIGFNDGLAAGQTVVHAHVHVVPRRSGDVADPRGGIRWVVADQARY
jgi:diadenosine tetraphosphate (Ap4A) HIT family hydrolase